MVTDCLAISSSTSNTSPSELCNSIESMVFGLKETAGWRLMEMGHSVRQTEEKSENKATTHP
jgi:hypothetical protein